jgi:hypothetical protein
MSSLEMTDDISWTKGESDDWMIESEYEEIYNSEGRKPGVVREHDGETGRFYQTYGGGGGPGGWGGYWIQDGRKSVWQVEGEVFTWLPTKRLHIMGVPYFPCSIHWWCKVVSLTFDPTS